MAGPNTLAEAGQMRPMKDWLTASSVPSSEPWTRTDLKTLMIYRDPLGNVIELFCYKGFEGFPLLPPTSRGGGTSSSTPCWLHARAGSQSRNRGGQA